MFAEAVSRPMTEPVLGDNMLTSAYPKSLLEAILCPRRQLHDWDLDGIALLGGLGGCRRRFIPQITAFSGRLFIPRPS